MAMELGRQIVFAYVERNSTLIEYEKPGLRLRMSLDPPIDDEMAAVAEGLRKSLGEATVLVDVLWRLNVLGGDPARAIDRLAHEVDARLIVLGGPRRGIAHRTERLLSGSVVGWLTRNQKRPLMVVPHSADSEPVSPDR